MLASLFIISLLFWNGTGSDSPRLTVVSTCSPAPPCWGIFIVTEPVSGGKSPVARLLFGIGVGLLTYLIRTSGGYPDGVGVLPCC